MLQRNSQLADELQPRLARADELANDALKPAPTPTPPVIEKPQAPPALLDPDLHASRGTHIIANYLAAAERKLEVLDLGNMSIKNIEFLSKLGCRVHVESITDTLNDLNATRHRREALVAEIAQHIEKQAARTRFDVILAWDLFNYLEPEAMTMLMQRISKFCRKGTLLFALVRIEETMPLKPVNFSFVNKKHLRYQTQAKHCKPCPQYSVVDLMNRLPGFSVLRTYLMENGMHEYVLGFRQK